MSPNEDLPWTRLKILKILLLSSNHLHRCKYRSIIKTSPLKRTKRSRFVSLDFKHSYSLYDYSLFLSLFNLNCEKKFYPRVYKNPLTTFYLYWNSRIRARLIVLSIIIFHSKMDAPPNFWNKMVGGNNLVDRVSKELANKYVNPARATPRKSGVNFS